MRVTIADIKKRLAELDGEEEGPIEVIVEARCTNDLDIEGELIHSFKVTYYPDGSTTREVLIDANNDIKGDNDNG